MIAQYNEVFLQFWISLQLELQPFSGLTDGIVIDPTNQLTNLGLRKMTKAVQQFHQHSSFN